MGHVFKPRMFPLIHVKGGNPSPLLSVCSSLLGVGGGLIPQKPLSAGMKKLERTLKLSETTL